MGAIHDWEMDMSNHVKLLIVPKAQAIGIW